MKSKKAAKVKFTESKSFSKKDKKTILEPPPKLNQIDLKK